ncbi:hypothetical protein SDC9_46980 [bioreactor metagenome]|uniref:Radical SAM core domain-containing protein n=1 Tax=bioreactor metagenome TaxID=1076179 RepID=A0A644WAC7_9ZZZZ
MKRILLVEPGYKNKYPPMGLMKISTYHKSLGDSVTFVKGIDRSLRLQVWDRIYITTLFTFDFEITINTINYYKFLVDTVTSLFIGGIMASLMPEKVAEATGIPLKNILVGLFTDTSKVGDKNDVCVDTLPLDYDILEQISYKYPAGDNYFAYTSRGCPNHCAFCAVPILEPNFTVTNNIVQQIEMIDAQFGPKRNLLMLDNNILNAPDLKKIVDALCQVGFGQGARYIDPGDYHVILMRYQRGDRAAFLDKRMKHYLDCFRKRILSQEALDRFLNIVISSEDAEDFAEYILENDYLLSPIIEKYRNKTSAARYIDFNQGIDGRRINDATMAQLARLAIRPLRIAFDDIKMSDIYKRAVRIAYNHGIREISNYILFNYLDSPDDLYHRLRINIELNQELGIQIFSFPMKYSPISYIDRSYIGEKWCTKYLLAISAILQVTKGVVAAGSKFFFRAFGRNIDEFHEILAMPRDLIMFRSYYENNGSTAKWRLLYYELNNDQRKRLLEIVSLPASELRQMQWPVDLVDIIPFYLIKYSIDKQREGST